MNPDPPSAVTLAQQGPGTVEQWQDVLNTLGSRAGELLPAVRTYAAHYGLSPLSATNVILHAAP